MTIRKSPSEWRALLDANTFAIARQAGTERPFTGAYWDHWGAGTYVCACCEAPLFESESKFDAHCGWPSFDRAIVDGHVDRITDTTLGMVRVEIRCRACEAHLGHVFPDGPTDTGERFCVNSASVRFNPGTT